MVLSGIKGHLTKGVCARATYVVALIAFGLVLVIFSYNIPKVSAWVLPNSNIPAPFNNLKPQSSGFGVFSNLPPSGYVIGSSNLGSIPATQPSLPANSVANTPFAPFASFGQFSSSNGGLTQTQNAYPYSNQNQNLHSISEPTCFSVDKFRTNPNPR